MSNFTKYLIIIFLMAFLFGVGFLLGRLLPIVTSSDKMAAVELVNWEYQTAPLIGDPVLIVYYKIINTGKVDLKRCIMGFIIEYNDDMLVDSDSETRHNVVIDFKPLLRPGVIHSNYVVIEDLAKNLPLILFRQSVVKNVQIDNWLIR